MKPPDKLTRLLPNLDTLAEDLETPERIVAQAMPPEANKDVALFAATTAIPAPNDPFGEARRQVLEHGRRAVEKLRQQDDPDLSEEELFGLEAIVLLQGRPAILIQEGHFFPPPNEWQILEQMRGVVEKTCHSVGRIEVTGHPSLEWIGTGFLVGEDVIMTNRHVAQEFAHLGQRRKWGFEPGMAARIDFVEELGGANSLEYAITEIVGIHETFDLALLRLEPKANEGAFTPEPMTIASKAPTKGVGHKVYAVGYPAWDGRRNDPVEMVRIFSNIFNVKRLSPGEIMRIIAEQSLFRHDCSTLGGNSGSCVVDLETNQVIGLHFGGRYLVGNQAVALWQLTGDRLLKKAKVNFA